MSDSWMQYNATFNKKENEHKKQYHGKLATL